MNNLPANQSNEHCREYYEDEISLIDVPKIIIKRWRWSLGAFLCFLLGTFFLLFYPGAKIVTLDYVSIYKAAESSPGSPIISLESTGEKAELYYIGLVVQNFIEQKKVEKLPFKIEVETSGPSGFVVIKSSASENDKEKLNEIKESHKELVELIFKEESILINHKKEIWERNLKNAKQALEMLKTAQSLNAVELSAKYMDQIVSFENALSGLRSGEILQLAYGNKPESKKKLIGALGIMSGFFMALIIPFFVEFFISVRQSLKEEENN